jgi:transposase-like protein
MFTNEQAADLKRVRAGEMKSRLAREYGISRETLYQYIRA